MTGESQEKRRRVVNIVNFVRGCEPRDPKMDLYAPVLGEIHLNRKYGFRNTFLLQYDAMLRQDFVELFHREKDERMELGVWIELCRPLTEAVGIPWRGRPGYDWEWYVNPGFLMAYTLEQRRALIDEIMRKFQELFGAYPCSVGSWLLDAPSMEYMTEKYRVQAFAICREQYSVDAYTVWGGYYNQAYYPSRKNMLCPAQTEQNTAPVFRMLSPDPIYNYDAVRYGARHNGCPTLEPVWESGCDPACIDWYFHSYFENECLNFAYAQLGQENSFGWERIEAGLSMQLGKLRELADKNAVTVEQLCETGKWFSSHFARTPATTLIADSDWSGNGLKSYWYDCINYRANVFLKGDHVFFRDIFLFDERFEEKYNANACTDWQAVYENLPVVDGLNWSTKNICCELSFDFSVKEIHAARCEKNSLRIRLDGADGEKSEIFLEETGITVKLPDNRCLRFMRQKNADTALCVKAHAVTFLHCGFPYEVPISGRLTALPNGYIIRPENGKVRLDLCHR